MGTMLVSSLRAGTMRSMVGGGVSFIGGVSPAAGLVVAHALGGRRCGVDARIVNNAYYGHISGKHPDVLF